MTVSDERASAVVHQAIHGYRRGHQLLGASFELSDDDASLLGTNSDSASRFRASDGPYLTGYPLTEKRYVVAQTWPDLDAERPNTVITRSLILSPADQVDVEPLNLLELLKPPTSSERENESLQPLHLGGGSGGAWRLSSEEAVLASRYYVADERLPADVGVDRERIALAIWKQLWKPANQLLHFCTVAGTTRFEGSMRPLLFAGVADERSDVPAAHHSIIEDLLDPGGFRTFVQFVGSGEFAVGLMQPFASAYELFNDPDPTTDEFVNLLSEYHALEPRRLRRLKRTFLGFDRSRPKWEVDQFKLLEALSDEEFGATVYASDASLGRWLSRCWNADAGRTANILEGSTAFSDAPSGPATAAEGIASAFASHASELISPETFEIAVALNRDAALTAVWDRDEVDLWRGWVDLESLTEVPSGTREVATYDWNPPLVAARGNAGALSRLLVRYPESLDELIVLADLEPADTDTAVDLSQDAARYIKNRLAHADEHLAGLARLSSPKELPDQIDTASWRRLLSKSEDEIVHATAYIVVRRANASYWAITALAFAYLYRALEGKGGVGAWAILRPRIKGDKSSWDRCGRLVADFAKSFSGLEERNQLRALALIKKKNSKAAAALTQHLADEGERRKNRFNLFDPSTW